MSEKICPVCEQIISPDDKLCPQCGWNFTRILWTPKTGQALQDKLLKARAAWQAKGMAPVSQLTSNFQGYNLILTWQWPQQAEWVLVCYRYDGFPRSRQDPKAVSIWCSRREYERNQFWQLRTPQDKPHYFAAYAAKSIDGPFSSALRHKNNVSQVSEVLYRIVKRKRFVLLGAINRIDLELTVKTAISLNELLLVGKLHTLPVAPDDGTQLMTFQQINLHPGNKVRLEIAAEHWSKDRVVRLFFHRSEDAEHIRLLHGKLETMRLG